MNKVAFQRTWSDEQLSRAVQVSTNWRGVIRELGLKSSSAGAIRIVRRRADDLGLDTSHFRGGRRWSDAQLKKAITGSRTWDEAIGALGLSASSGSIRPFLKSHAVRLGIDCSHLASRPPAQSALPDDSRQADPEPDLLHLREAAVSIAAAWLTLSGCAISLPIEPAVYDLLAEFPDDIKRIQVKTTTFSGKDGWQVGVSHKQYLSHGRRRHAPYEVGDIDYFFIVDGELNMYLIPALALAGATRVLLRTYSHYAIGNARGLRMPPQPASAA